MMPRGGSRNFTEGGTGVDFVCALAATLCAGGFTFLVHLLKPREFDVTVFLKFLLMAATAYFAVALALSRWWVGGLRRMVPSWIPISVFGSTLFVMIRLLPAVVSGWAGPSPAGLTLSGYVGVEIDAARSVVIVLTLITLPATALFYHADSILKAVRRWHGGPESPPSITTLRPERPEE
jgi:hypothetical protein